MTVNADDLPFLNPATRWLPENRKRVAVTALALQDGAAGQLYESEATARAAFSRLVDEPAEWYIGTGEWRDAVAVGVVYRIYDG